MINLGLRASEKRDLLAAVVATNELHVEIELMNLAQDSLGSLTEYLVDGQVDMDVTSDQVNTRQLTMQLADPERAIPFDTNSPADTALFMDRMIQVRYGFVVNGGWIYIPVFTGPVTGLFRDGSQITVTCKSKEVLAMGSVWPAITFKRNMKRTDALTTLLQEAGESNNHLDIPDLAARLAKPLALHRTDQYWPKAQSLAKSMNRQLFYDGRGFCHLRTWPGLRYTFFDSRDVVGTLQITYTQENVSNSVMIVGATPKHQKRPIVATAVAPANHPLSPIRLGRNGKSRHILLQGQMIDRPDAKTQKEANDIANQLLDDALMTQVDVQFDCMPGSIAMLDPSDLCHVVSEGMVVPFRLKQYSLPLRDGGSASVGYHKTVSIRKARRQRGARRRPR